MQYLVILERGAESWGAHVPDLPGCIAVADSREGVIQLIQGAIALHVKALRADGINVPEPVSESTYLPIEVIQKDLV